METAIKQPHPVTGAILLMIDAALAYIVLISSFISVFGILHHISFKGTAKAARSHIDDSLFYQMGAHPAFLIMSLLVAVFTVIYAGQGIKQNSLQREWWIALLMFSCLILIPTVGSVVVGLMIGCPLK